MMQQSGHNSRILLHSLRQLFGSVRFRLSLYELENVICEVDAVDMVAPRATGSFPYRSRLATRLASDVHVGINPGLEPVRVDREYELFVSIVHFPRDLLYLKHLHGWKDRCRASVCYVNEVWLPDIARIPYYLRVLSEFDYVLLQQSGSIKPLSDAIQKPCSYLPAGIDAQLFCPYPALPDRVIDVYSIGRRSEVSHKVLKNMAAQGRIFYLYDTATGSEVNDGSAHRALFANTAKRSRYFIVNPGKINDTAETGGQVEFGPRFFEGAAAGTIMLGETPANEHYSRIFNWPDAIVHVPFESDAIETVMMDLDRQPERQDRIRTDNVVQSLLHHDWSHRWETILNISGLKPMTALLERQQRLADLAHLVQIAPPRLARRLS
jgi:hypothetical protein